MTGSHRLSRREAFPLVLHLEPEVPLARWEPGWCWWCQVPPAILLLPAPCCLGNSGICSYLLAKSSSASITSFLHQPSFKRAGNLGVLLCICYSVSRNQRKWRGDLTHICHMAIRG